MIDIPGPDAYPEHHNAMTARMSVYIVAYGSNLSEQRCPSWKEAAAFIKHCLDSEMRIREVRKENAPLTARFISKDYLAGKP